MSLTVFIESAKNIPNVETFGKSDPYVNVEFQGIRKKSEVIKGELNPVWNEKLNFNLQGKPIGRSDEIKIEIKDWEMVGRNRLLAMLNLSLRPLSSGQSKISLNHEMLDGNGRKTGCTIKGEVIYEAPAKKQQASGGGSQVYAEEGDEEETEQDEDPEDAEEDEDEDEGVGDVTDTGTRRKKKKKKRRSQKKSRGKLSSKPQDFQVRIKIVEARQLPGANISPVTRVTCYGQTKQTRVQKSTNSPFWNEVFFFNFFASPAELFDELIDFQVFNSRKLRSDSFIGSFKCDIGMVYDEPGHSLLNKWLLLSDPEDHMAGAKGYLKIMATVLGPGDDAPSFKPSSQEDEEDIESNLLRPAGVQLRPATFKLKVYKAEDIPRMDSGAMEGLKKAFGMDEKKELVDPYFVFSFAGQEVKSKVLYNCDHPEWSQELKLGLRFPSMCERIKLQVFDWDRVTNHDPICSGHLKLSEIATSGDNGFLPSFGPCYVNLYGSTREYSDLPDEYEDLNLGKGEGVAYRGRVLVELQTLLGEMPEVESEDIHNDDLLRVQKFQRRRKYKLHAAFLNATMISEVDAPIEFEVSIGNYGNKLDENVPPCSSTTQPTNAVFDGCYYYFLPWGETKPCTVVDSHWEDISFRLEALNMILSIIDRLETKIERVRVGLKANLSTPELAQLLIALLDQLVVDCSKSLPAPVDGQHVQNELDRQLRMYREAELDHIVAEASKLRENATDVNEALHEADNYLQLLKSLSIEPQNSMPDVVIWMISGTKRIAYFRCPAYMVLYSQNPDFRGKYCGKLETIQLRYPGNKAEKDNRWEVPAMLRVKIWLGLEQFEEKWHTGQQEGELSVFAETYENQVSIMGNWTNKGPTMSRPKFSDATGKVKLDMNDFVPPPGWRWGADWYVSPELSMLFDKDAGHTKFMEDCYENQSRIPAGHWDASSVPFTDVKGDAGPSKDEIALPDGWSWEDDWQVDLNRAVDEEGWEYTVEATLGGYGPVQKNYHMCRRRRWLRMRNLVKSSQMQQEEEELAKDAREGWEYAPMFNMKFHAKERKMDMVRRRRYHRKMVCDDPNAPCFFQMSSKEKSIDRKEHDKKKKKVPTATLR